jgi:hypothetical protein
MINAGNPYTTVFLFRRQRRKALVADLSPRRPLRSQTSPCGIFDEQSGTVTLILWAVYLCIPLSISFCQLFGLACLVCNQHNILSAIYSIVKQSTFLCCRARSNHVLTQTRRNVCSLRKCTNNFTITTKHDAVRTAKQNSYVTHSCRCMSSR